MHYSNEYGRSFSSDNRHMHQNQNKFSDSQYPHMYKYSDANTMYKYSDANSYKSSDTNAYKNSDANSILRKSDSSYSRPESEKSKKIETSDWVVKSGCHFGCMHKGKGIQVVTAANNGTNNIQLCSPKYKVCRIL